jgi:hypothetical protein
VTARDHVPAHLLGWFRVLALDAISTGEIMSQIA